MLQFEMEEGLAFCHKLKTKYFVSQMLTSGRDCQKFKDISDSIQRQLTVIAAAAAVETHDIITDEFEQGQALRDKIAELGGAAAVAADPELKAQCAAFMKASDELIVGAVDEVARAVQLEAQKSQRKMDEMMELLADVPQVVLVTNDVDREYTDANNSLIYGAYGARSNVYILDWGGNAPGCPGDCFYSDEIHLRPEGADYYALLIANVLGIDA